MGLVLNFLTALRGSQGIGNDWLSNAFPLYLGMQQDFPLSPTLFALALALALALDGPPG